MAKLKQHKIPHQHQRGEIQDNALKALVTSSLFRQRVEKQQKGKGSYKRKPKHSKSGYENPIIKVLLENFNNRVFSIYHTVIFY